MIITPRDLSDDIKFRVFFNGRDFTKECFYVDTNGAIRTYCKDKNDLYFVDENGSVAFKELNGKVELRMIFRDELITDLEKIESIVIMERLTK